MAKYKVDISGVNTSGGKLTTALGFVDSKISNRRLTCQDKEDQFTLKVAKGGTLGYGNNALDYPVGLLTVLETQLVNESANYLNNNDNYWLLSPNYFTSSAGVYGKNYGGVSYYGAASILGARPAISIKKNIKISGGTGEKENPYTLSLT